MKTKNEMSFVIALMLAAGVFATMLALGVFTPSPAEAKHITAGSNDVPNVTAADETNDLNSANDAETATSTAIGGILPPNVTFVAPNSGPTAGGTLVTITGTDFFDGATVTIGRTAATGVTFGSATTITATTPAHTAGAVDLVVTNPDGQSGTLVSGFTYIPPPTCTLELTPSYAGGTLTVDVLMGTSVGVTANLWGISQSDIVSLFNGPVAVTEPPTNATITKSIPPSGVVGVLATLTTPELGIVCSDFKTVDTGSPVPPPIPPTVTSVAPATGPTSGGTLVTLTGTDFVDGATVTFGGTAAFGVTVINSTTITATTPANAAGAVDVVVTNPDSQSSTLASGFTFIVPPIVTSVDPVSGPAAGGTVVTVTGIGLVGPATVTFGGTAATGVTVINSKTITATTPANAAGTVDVVVTNPDSQSSTLVSSFTFIATP